MQGTTPDQLLTTITKIGTGPADQGHSPILTDTAATVAMIPTEAIPGHIKGTTGAITGALHDTLTPIFIIPAVTPIIGGHLHTGAYQLAVETLADFNPDQHTDHPGKPCRNLHPILV